jgi:hypothetical protein
LAVFKFWAFPQTVALIVSLIATPVVGVLAGIFIRREIDC